MKERIDLWRQLTGLRERRRGGYMAAGVVTIGLAVYAVGRSTPPTDTTDSVAPDPVVESVAAPVALPAAAPPAPVAPQPPPPLNGDAAYAFPSITDGVPRVARPDVVKGLYLNAWAAGSTRKLTKLIDIANRTEINTFVIDVKEGGEISYRSRVPLARQIGADQEYIRDVRAVLRRLREHGIYPIARIVVFKDEVLAKARPDWAVQNADGTPWYDSDQNPWVDSFNKQVWDYNIAIAREALELGFSEVQWDYVRFPDVPRRLMDAANWPARAGRLKEDAIREFLMYSRETLTTYDVPVTADVFGLTVSTVDDMGIGQQWEKMLDATDVLLPMVYPSHFARGSYGIAHPNANPRTTVLKAMEHAQRRTAGKPNAATIRPWLQDFTLGPPRYEASHVRAQIEAVYEAGLKEWVLWNPGSNYTVDALLRDGEVSPAVRDTSGAPLGRALRTDTTATDTGRLLQ